MNLYTTIITAKKQHKKLFAVLIDPDKCDSGNIIPLCEEANVDLIFIGGSIITNGDIGECIKIIKQQTNIPVIIFPGNTLQVNKSADAILLLSLISGRNADLLIGNHVSAAATLKKSTLEILPTGYVLIDSGKQTAASYMSNTTPIPYEKDDIATATAIAGEMLGLKLIYLDSGSGAEKTVKESMISSISDNIEVPIIVGGGIDNSEKAINIAKAGADVIVVGNAIEKDTSLITSISQAIHNL